MFTLIVKVFFCICIWICGVVIFVFVICDKLLFWFCYALYEKKRYFEIALKLYSYYWSLTDFLFLHMIAPFLKILKQIKTIILSITAIHKNVKVYTDSYLLPWIIARNILFLYSLMPHIHKYLLITYFSIDEIYPVFFTTGIISLLLSCVFTINIQNRWYKLVKILEDNAIKANELQKKIKSESGEAVKQSAVAIVNIPFAYSKKTIIIIFAIIVFWIGVDYLCLHLLGYSLILAYVDLFFQ